MKLNYSLILIILPLAFSCSTDSLEDYPTARMADGRIWTTQNLRVVVDSSWCYEDSDANCEKYGRLYTWEAAQKACEQLGRGWRLPSDKEWNDLVDLYGGVYQFKTVDGRAAYKALIEGGASGFKGQIGGYRDVSGQYFALERYGYYWSSTAREMDNAWSFSFQGAVKRLGRGSSKKDLAFSCRCIKEQ